MQHTEAYEPNLPNVFEVNLVAKDFWKQITRLWKRYSPKSADKMASKGLKALATMLRHPLMTQLDSYPDEA